MEKAGLINRLIGSKSGIPALPGLFKSLLARHAQPSQRDRHGGDNCELAVGILAFAAPEGAQDGRVELFRFDVALRRFKRTIEKLGLLTDLRAALALGPAPRTARVLAELPTLAVHLGAAR